MNESVSGDLCPACQVSLMRRLMVWAWIIVFVLLVITFGYPVTTRMMRLFIVCAIPVLWIGLAILLYRRNKWAAIALGVAGVLAADFLCWKGSRPNPQQMRASYVQCLWRYEATPYVWGGENRRGIDCSGLVRNGLIDAHTILGFRNVNPRLLRIACDLWWHDCTAKSLRDGFQGFTVRLTDASSINAIPDSVLQLGDMAVTADGIHVLAYLGGHEWIEADPVVKKVIQVSTPAENSWFRMPVIVVRWAPLDVMKSP